MRFGTMSLYIYKVKIMTRVVISMRKHMLLAITTILLELFVVACGSNVSETTADVMMSGIAETAEIAEEMVEVTNEQPEKIVEEIAEQTIETDKETEAVLEESIPKDYNLHYVDALGEWHDTTIHAGLNMHPYDFSKLENDGQNICYDDGIYTIRHGIDVSHHQGKINWEQVKAAGYDFVILRCAYRGYGKAGNLCEDKEFPGYIDGAHAAGMDVGVYIFSQAISEEEAVEEADYVINILKDRQIELPVTYDPETIRDDEARTDNLTGEQATLNTIAFCERIKSAGYEPMIYSNMIWEADFFDMSRVEQYPKWYADYELSPQTPYDFMFWQYSETGIVDGVHTPVDLDVWFVKK